MTFLQLILLGLAFYSHNAVWADIIGKYQLVQVTNRWSEEVPLPYPTHYKLEVDVCPRHSSELYYCLYLRIYNYFLATAPEGAGGANKTQITFARSTKMLSPEKTERELDSRVNSILLSPRAKLSVPSRNHLKVKSRLGRMVFRKTF